MDTSCFRIEYVQHPKIIPPRETHLEWAEQVPTPTADNGTLGNNVLLENEDLRAFKKSNSSGNASLEAEVENMLHAKGKLLDEQGLEYDVKCTKQELLDVCNPHEGKCEPCLFVWCFSGTTSKRIPCKNTHPNRLNKTKLHCFKEAHFAGDPQAGFTLGCHVWPVVGDMLGGATICESSF